MKIFPLVVYALAPAIIEVIVVKFIILKLGDKLSSYFSITYLNYSCDYFTSINFRPGSYSSGKGRERKYLYGHLQGCSRSVRSCAILALIVWLGLLNILGVHKIVWREIHMTFHGKSSINCQKFSISWSLSNLWSVSMLLSWIADNVFKVQRQHGIASY